MRITVFERSNMERVVYSVDGGTVLTEGLLEAHKVDERIPYKVLNPVQTVFEKYYSGGSVLVASPTSSGKSLIAYLFFRRHMDSGRMVYLAPLRALASEKAKELRQYFGSEVELRSGDDFFSSLKEPVKKVLVCTYDYFQIALRNRSSWTSEVSAVVFDEIHTVLKRPVYEELVVLSRAYPQLGLSATLPSLDKVADWLDVSLLIRSDWRPVRLERSFHQMVERKVKKGLEKDDRDGLRIFEMLYSLKKPGEQVLLFVPRKSLGWKVLEIADREKVGVLNEFVPFEKSDEEREPEVAFHNADVPLEERRQIEELFRAGKLPVLVATQTLAYGVNLPADRVIVFVNSFVDRDRRVRVTRPDMLDIRQMEGRAGRYGLKERGYVDFLLYGIKEEEFWKEYELMEVEPEVKEVSTLMVLLAVHHAGRNYMDFLSKTYNFAGFKDVQSKVDLLHRYEFLSDYSLTFWGRFCVNNSILPEQLLTFRRRLGQGLSYEYLFRPLIRRKFDSMRTFQSRYPQLEEDRKVVCFKAGRDMVFLQETFDEGKGVPDNTEDFVLYIWGIFSRYPGFKLPAEYDLSLESLYLLRNLMVLKDYLPYSELDIFLYLHSIRHGLLPEWSLLGSVKGIGYVRGNMLLKALKDIKALPPEFDQTVGSYFDNVDSKELEEKLRENFEERELKSKVISSEIKKISSFIRNQRDLYFFDEAIARVYLYLSTKQMDYLVAGRKKLLDSLKDTFYVSGFFH